MFLCLSCGCVHVVAYYCVYLTIVDHNLYGIGDTLVFLQQITKTEKNTKSLMITLYKSSFGLIGIQDVFSLNVK